MLLTIGHSNHPLDQLVSLLRTNQIDGVADVRSWPASRYAPWFDRAPLADSLREVGIQYVFLGRELGGRPADERMYDADGHVRYDAVATTDEFKHGLQRLRRAITTLRIAAMCAEENPENCHRRLLVARVLYDEGTPVLHIRGDGRTEREDGFNQPNSLFEDSLPWRSTASVSRRRQPRASSTV